MTKKIDNVVKLSEPFEYIDPETKKKIYVDSLTIGRLKIKHLKALPENFVQNDGQIDANDLPPLIAALANLPMEAIEEIDFVDLPAIVEITSSFLDTAPSIGKK